MLQRVRADDRQAARRHEHGIETLLVVAIGRMAADPELGRPGDAAGLARGKGGLGLGRVARRLTSTKAKRRPRTAIRSISP